jgi:hypothetical protein
MAVVILASPKICGQSANARFVVMTIEADADALVHGIAGATGWARVWIAELDLRLNEIANRLHPLRAAGHLSDRAQAKSASLSLSQ